MDTVPGKPIGWKSPDDTYSRVTFLTLAHYTRDSMRINEGRRTIYVLL
jgi:hypothetical protein